MSRLAVTRLNTTAVKGLRVAQPDEIALGPGGAAGDRAFFLVGADDRVRSVPAVGALLRMQAEYDEPRGWLAVRCDDGRGCADVVRLGAPVTAEASGGKRIAGHEVLGPWSALISEVAGQRLRVVKAAVAGGAHDLTAVTLLGDGSLRELERRSALALDSRRFRMLIEFGPSAPHVEDGWEGRLLEVGAARLRVAGPVPRCAATTRHPQHGRRDAPTVRAIRDYRGTTATAWGDAGVPFGVYADVVRAGRVRVGDAVRLA